jgi:hypothetical protein
MDMPVLSVHRASALYRSNRAPEIEPGSVESRREERPEDSGTSRWNGWARGCLAIIADHGSEPDDDSSGAERIVWRRPSTERSSAPTRGWSETLGKKRTELTRRFLEILDGTTAGDPMSTIKWTRKSTRFVSKTLKVSHSTAWRMLRANRYRLRYNRKRLARKGSPDRDEQFRVINRLRGSFGRRGEPIISVDAKKRELVGLFKNHGRTWRRVPMDVSIYDFPSDAEGVAIPYGIYDVTRGDGFVVVGTSHNTPAFAANAVQKWWDRAGRHVHSRARELLILADSGSSNGARAHDWKSGLQQIANRTGLRIRVAHYPPGASKWNPVEHRLFGPISTNWAGEPLVDYTTVCQYIRHTRTASGARCKVFLDRHTWPTQKELNAAGFVPTENRAPLAIRHAKVLPHLNYTVVPRTFRRK